jgi:hypothetical protein
MLRLLFFASCLPLSGLAQPSLLQVNGAIRQKETKTWSLTLVKNKTYYIHAEQIGIDFALILMGDKGDTLQYHDSTNGSRGPEIITHTAANTGRYIVNISAFPSAHIAEGKFSLVVFEIIALNKDTYITGTLSPWQMQRDLAIFKQIRERANPGLYRYRTKEQIDSTYRWALSRMNRRLSLLGFYKIIVALNDFEGSSHTWESLPYESPNDLKYHLPAAKGYFPFEVKYIEGKMVINTADGVIPLGSRVLNINGIPDSIVMRSLYVYRMVDGYNLSRKQISSIDDKFGQRYQAAFGTMENFVIQYTLPHDAIIQTRMVKSISRAEAEQQSLHRHSLPFDNSLDYKVAGEYDLKMLNDTVAIVIVREFNMASNKWDPAYNLYSRKLDSFFRVLRIAGVKNLVVDIRHNPGGSGTNFEKLFTYLANSRFRENKLAYIIADTVPYPEYYNWASTDPENRLLEEKQIEKDLASEFTIKDNGRYLQDSSFNPYWYPDSNRFIGKLFLLIDEYDGSAGSHFASLAKAYSDCTIVGMETGGGYYGISGHIPFEYRLPNSKITIGFSIVFVEQDAPKKASEPFGRGVTPDYEISQSLDDFFLNHDTQMEYVLHYIFAR